MAGTPPNQDHNNLTQLSAYMNQPQQNYGQFYQQSNMIYQQPQESLMGMNSEEQNQLTGQNPLNSFSNDLFNHQHSIQQLAQQLSQQAQHIQQQPQIDLQMQQIQQMRMLQSLGQYSQLGALGQFSQFGQSYGSSAPPTSSSSSQHENHLKNNFHKPEKPAANKAKHHGKIDNRSKGGGKIQETGRKGKKKKTSNVKRPTTAYLYFVSKYREKLKQTGEPMPKAKEMMQECAAKWRGMDVDGKREYQDMADKDKERWMTEKAAERKPKDQWRPKRPPSAYFLFLADFRRQWKEDNADKLEAAQNEGKVKVEINGESDDKDIEERLGIDTLKNDENQNTSSVAVKMELDEVLDENEIKTENISEADGLKIDEGVIAPPEIKPPIIDPGPAPKKVKGERKTSRVVEITKKAGERWNQMTEEDKAPYVAKAQETRIKWEKQLQIYKHELKIGKSGEEASGRIIDLEAEGGTALDVAIAGIPNTPADSHRNNRNDINKNGDNVMKDMAKTNPIIKTEINPINPINPINSMNPMNNINQIGQHNLTQNIDSLPIDDTTSTIESRSNESQSPAISNSPAPPGHPSPATTPSGITITNHSITNYSSDSIENRVFTPPPQQTMDVSNHQQQSPVPVIPSVTVGELNSLQNQISVDQQISQGGHQGHQGHPVHHIQSPLAPQGHPPPPSHPNQPHQAHQAQQPGHPNQATNQIQAQQGHPQLSQTTQEQSPQYQQMTPTEHQQYQQQMEHHQALMQQHQQHILSQGSHQSQVSYPPQSHQNYDWSTHFAPQGHQPHHHSPGHHQMQQ